MNRRFRNRSARHFGTGQGISPAMRRPVKRASRTANTQAWNILRYFGKPTVRAWAKGDPNGYAVASQLEDIDFDGSVAKALREAIGYQAKSRFSANRKNAMNHTHRRANRKTASDVINELWFDRDTGDVYEIWIDGNYVVGYNLTFEGGPFTVSEVAGESVYSPSDFRLQRDGVVSKDDITVWGLVPIDTLEKGQAIEIIERNGYPMPASLGHARDSHRANRKGSINETLLKELMDEIVERERETGGWGAGDFNSDIEEVLWRRMTSPHSTKRLQDDLGVPINEDWRYDAEGMTDLRFISVREFLHDQRWEDIFDAEYGSRYNASHRANRRVAGTTKQDLAGITVTTKDMGSGWEFYVARGEQGGFEWYLFNPSGELDTIRLTNSIDKALGIAEIIVEEKLKSQNVTDEERDQMMRDNEDYLRGLKGGSRRANRKVAEYDPTNVFQNEGVWEIAEMVWDSRLLTYDVSDEVIEEKIRDYSETFLGEVADAYFVDSVMNILKENLKHSNRRANRKRANADLIETVELGGGFSADIWFDPAGEFTGEPEYVYEVYRGGEAITIGSTSTFDEAVYKAEFSALNAEDYMNGGYGFDRPNYHSSRRATRRTARPASRRANRKSYKSKLDLYFSAFNRAGDMVEITAKPDGNGYIWSYQGPDYGDYDKMMITLPFEEAYNLFLREMGLTQGDFFGPEIYTHTANRRANRKRASERMNYGTVYVVTSDGDVVEGDTPGDMEFVSVHVYADDQPEVGYYDFGPIVDELYEGVVSSIGAEPVEVVPDYFIGDMGVSADELAKFGPGEYRLCPVSLSYWVGEGEFGDLEYDDGFNYDVVVRY